MLAAVRDRGATRHIDVGPINHATTEAQVGELRDALSQLERDGLVRMIRQNTVQVFG